MADKKITELGALTEVTADDLFVIVNDPTGTPVTKKITVGAVFNTLKLTTSTSGTNATSLIKAVLEPAANADVSGYNTLVAGEFVVNSSSTSTTSKYQYGIVARSALNGITSNVAVEHASGKFILDVSNTAVVASNTSVLRVEVANTGTRTANVQSFISFGDKAANSTTAQTLYLFDIGQNGSVSANTSDKTNVTCLLGNATSLAVPTHKLRIRVNGTDYWILLVNATNAVK